MSRGTLSAMPREGQLKLTDWLNMMHERLFE